MKNDGGPAFPTTTTERIWSEEAMVDLNLPDAMAFGSMTHAGMTLRDYFAIRAPEPTADAINGEGERDRLANPHGDSYKPKRRSRLEIIAELRYAYADAMLAERVK